MVVIKNGWSISDEKYLMCKQIWKEFDMKNMGDYHDHYIKKMFCCWQMFLRNLLTYFKILWT